jgi:two-component system CheB/CheR fusion protein
MTSQKKTGATPVAAGGKAGRSKNARELKPHGGLIVGIGASAGGLEAFKAFFAHMPADSELAFVLVQHLSPDHESLLSLKRSTACGSRCGMST